MNVNQKESVEQPEGLQLKINLSKWKILSGSWEAFPGGMVSKGSGGIAFPGELPSQHVNHLLWDQTKSSRIHPQ